MAVNIITGLRKGQPSAAPKSYAQELGWTSRKSGSGTIHTGHYSVLGFRRQGWIFEHDQGKLEFYIFKPPIELLRATEYAGCFHARQDDWWLVAFKPSAAPVDVSSGIAAIQKSLRRAFEVHAASRRSRR